MNSVAQADAIQWQTSLSQAQSLARADAHGLRPRAMLDNNDGYSFFQALGDLVVCGPTLTNVNDFRAILVQSARIA